MSFVIGGIEIQMMADLARLKQDMDQAKGMVGEASRFMQSAATAAGMALGALGASLSIGGVVQFVRSMADASAELNDLAIQTGATVESLSEFAQIGATTNTSAQTIAGAMNKLAKGLAVSSEESKGAGAALKALGLDFNTFIRLRPEEQMLTLAKALNKFEDSSGKSAVAMTLIRGEGAKLLPFFKDLAEAGKVNSRITTEQSAAADAFMDSIAAVGSQLKLVSMQLVADMLPTLTKLAGLIEPLIKLTAAYFAVFVAGPALLAAAVSGLTALQLAMLANINVSGVFAMSLAATRLSMGAIITQFGLLKVAAGLGFAAFAGWELGKWAQENFEPVRHLGVSIIEVMMTSIERVKFFGGAFAEVFSFIVGSQSWATTKKNFSDLNAQTDKNIVGIKAITKEMHLEAVQAFRTAVSIKEHKDQLVFNTDALAKTDAASKKAADAAAKHADELKKLTTAGNEYLQNQVEKNAATQREIDLGRNLTAAELAQLDLTRKLAEGKLVMSAATQASTRAEIDLAGQLAINKQWMLEITAENASATDAIYKKAESLRSETEKQIEANAAIGLSTTAIGDMKMARLFEMAVAADKIAQLIEEKSGCTALSQAQRDLAEEYRKAAAAAGTGAHLTAAKEAADEWKKTSDSIQDSMTDAIFRALEDGKSLWLAFRDVLVNTFKTTVLKPIIQMVMSPITGGIGSMFASGGASAAGAAGGSGGGGLGSMLGLGAMGGLGGIFGAGASMTMAGGFGTAMQGAGSMMANGSIMQGAAQGAGALAPYAAGAAVGVYGGRAISNGYSAIGSSGNTAVNAGTIIGAVVGGPIGAAIGGAIGGVVNRAFGTKTSVTGTGITGTISGSDFGGNSFTDWQKKGGWFRSSSSGTTLGALEGDALAALRNSSAAVAAQVKSYAQVLGLPTAAIANVSKQIRIQLTDDQAANEAAISKVFSAYQDELASAVSSSRIQIFKKLGESYTETLGRLAGIQRMTDQMQDFGGVFGRIAALSINAKDELIGFAGSIDALISKTRSFVSNYYTEGEQAGISARQIQAQLSALGLSSTQVSGLDSRADFRALIEKTDLSSSAGRQQFNALLDVAQQFASVGQYLEQNGGTLATLARLAPRQFEIFDSVINAQNPSMTNSRAPGEVEFFTSKLGQLNTTTAMVSETITNSIAALTTAVVAKLESVQTQVKDSGRQTADTMAEYMADFYRNGGGA